MKALALLLLGLWLGVIVGAAVVAVVNFRTVDRVLTGSELQQKLESVSAGDRRMALRHLVSEVNRWMFRWSLVAQVVVGAAVLAASWSQGSSSRVLIGAALSVAVLQALLLVGPITDLGRSLDFVPRPLPPDVAGRFGRLHGAYTLSDLAKLICLSAAAAFLARRPGPW